MLSLLGVVHAWVRVVALPAAVWLVAAQYKAPALGWPRLSHGPLAAAWLFVALVPISGISRVAEVDIVVLAGLSFFALHTSHRRTTLLLAAWVVVAVTALHMCGTWVVTRFGQCATLVPTQTIALAGLLAALVVLVVCWPRDTVPARMIWLGIGGLGIEVVRQLAMLWL